MDLNELQLTTVLQEAFTCYLAFLSHQQKAREAKLPRQGKGVETSADVSTRDHYRSRVAGIETCIQCSDRIARRVLRWSNDPDEIIRDEPISLDPQAEQLAAFLEEDSQFLDHFTGAWVHPITPYSAGPSSKDGGTGNKRVETSNTTQTKCLPKTPSVEEKETKTPEVKIIRPAFRSSTRPSLGLHPNVLLSISSINKDKIPPPKLIVPQSASLLTPESSTTSEDESESEDKSSDEREQDSKTANEHKREEKKEVESSEDSEDSEDESSEDSEDSDGDDTSITSEMASAFYQQRGGKNAAQAQKLHAEEKTRKENILRSRQQARQRAENWAREEKSRLDAQEAYAKRLEREERAREEQIRRDREAAQREQARWELAAIALVTETKRTEERRRRQADERRAADEQRRSRNERERPSRPDDHSRIQERSSKEDGRSRAESRTRHRDHERRRSPLRRPSPPRRAEPYSAPPKKARFSDREPSKRRSSSSAPSRSEPPRKLESPKRTESTRRTEPARRVSPPARADPPKKSDPPKQVDCVSCMEPGNKNDMTVLECKHAYCTECVNEAFKSAYKSHTLFKCCGKTVKATSISALSSSISKKYTLLDLELSTPNPKFCSRSSCSTFLPPSSIHGPLGICTSCKTRTCILCGNAEHSGVCKQDKEGKKLEDLAKKKGWKQCPNCSQILERTYGCLHMTCRCGANWCYSCLRDWDICGSACSRDDPDNGYLHAALPPGGSNPWVRLVDLAGVPARNRNPAAAAAANFHAALGGGMGQDVQMQHDRGTGSTRMRGEGAGSVFPVIATAVLMALMRDRE